MESNNKKIQFAVPVLQRPLDPKAAEHIRRRRPTPATLVVYREPSVEPQTSSRPCENVPHAQLCPAQRKHSVYTPPTLAETDNSRNQEARDKLPLPPPVATPLEEPACATPRRKDTPYQHLPPFTPGGRLLDAHTPFSEEEEGEEEEEEEEGERGPQ